jgi:Flp pilus assembly protein TadD
VVDPTPSDYHLTYLRERWERDRSSRVFLQLAEEYRRRGLHTEALEVLQVGLSHHPGYLAAQVSLGRCRLEAGQAGEAAEVLTRVLSQDPTQAVASRLLIEVWLQLRDAERARAAIDRCKLLGVQPAEMQGYEGRLTELLAQQDSLAPPPAATQPAPPAQPAAATRPAPEALPPPSVGGVPADAVEIPEPATVASAPPEPPEPPRPAPPAPRPAAPPPAAPPPASSHPPAAAAGREVFHLPRLTPPPLALPRPAARRLLRVAGGSPFELTAPVPVAPVVGPVFELGPFPVPATPPRPFPAPRAAPAIFEPVEEEPVAPAAREPAPAAAPAAVPASAPLPPVQTGPALEEPILAPPGPEEPPPWWRGGAGPATPPAAPAAGPAVLEPATLVEPSHLPAAPVTPPAAAAPPSPPETAATAGSEAGSAQPPGSPWAGASPGVERQPSGTLPAPELRPSDPGTATLGELYLRQGHLGEARKIFHQVLERDPDNEVALRGLEAIGRRRGASLTAAELVTGEEPEARGLTARKILLLERYLHQLKAGAGNPPGARSDVPGAAE